MRVRDLLDMPGLGLRLLTDVTGMDRMIRHVYTTDLPDPSRYLTPGDLVLTGLIWYREPSDADRFVTALVKAGTTALGAGEALGEVPPAHELRESVAELAADVALERARLDAGRTGDRKLAEAIVTMLASGGGEGAAPVEIASLMRAAGLPSDGRYLVAAMCAEGDRVAGPNAGRWRCDLAEELAAPLAPGALIAPLGDEIVMLVPAPGDLSSADGAAADTAARIRGAQPVFESDRSRIRLTAGVSAPAEGVTALSGSLHEAGSARRLAALRGTTAISVVTSDEVASHELLLASVPASVLRSFRERLLGPLLSYDERHRAELVPTLREFLACSGSWNACAATMYVHVNTVRYRIRRIEELTGRDLSCLDDQVDFFLAVRIR